MILKLRQRLAQEESGFTLIELLVVMLILGILAAIAIPAFLNQAQKGEDSKAIANIRTTETSAETYATQNRGSYQGMDNTALEGIEPAMRDFDGAAGFAVTVTGGGTGYTVQAVGSPGHTFTLTRLDTGVKQRTCVPVNAGSCVNGTWGN
jgi:type IV pilus assembly protein PilA